MILDLVHSKERVGPRFRIQVGIQELKVQGSGYFKGLNSFYNFLVLGNDDLQLSVSISFVEDECTV